MEQSYIRAIELVKIFKVADLEVFALQGLDLEIERGEFLALVGPSGSGKSTLLSALGGLDKPSAGSLFVAGQNLLTLNQAALTNYRRTQVGFVWQQTARNLLPYLTARQNVELLASLAGRSKRERKEWIDEILEAVGAQEFANRKPPQLSGGQQQRVAIACALANKPTLLLGDEPTGEVDWPTAEMILALLRTLRTRYNLTIVTVTHDSRVAAAADRVIAIRDGRVSSEVLQDSITTLHANEQAIVDRVGRLQIPIEQRRLAGIGRRVQIEVVDGGLLLRPGSAEANDPLLPSADDTLNIAALYGLTQKHE